MRDRHLFGVGAAVCAACCTAPILSVLGIVGAAATAFTFAFAGAVFAAVVGFGAGLAWLTARRRARAIFCPSDELIVLDSPAPIGGNS